MILFTCNQDERKFGWWKLRFKYCSSAWGGECVVLKEWNVEYKNIDRGRLELALPDNPESILPDGLEVEPNTSAGGDTTRLSVYFETCDGPVQNQSISFRQKFINGKGGHNHDEPPECGATSTHPTCGNIIPATVTTDKNGNASATYNAPIYSGESETKAQTNYNGYERESKKKIYHLIEGLQPITSRTGLVVLADNQNCIHGSINNYLTADMKDAVYDFVNEFIYGGWRPNTAPVYMTAGSLVAGGKFDDGVCWSENNSGNHLYHRQGKDADLDYSYIIDGVDMGVFLLRSCLDIVNLRLGLREYGNHTDHIHIRKIR